MTLASPLTCLDFCRVVALLEAWDYICNNVMDKENVDDDESRRVSQGKDRFGFTKLELGSTDVIVKSTPPFKYDRQAYSIMKRVLFFVELYAFAEYDNLPLC